MPALFQSYRMMSWDDAETNWCTMPPHTSYEEQTTKESTSAPKCAQMCPSIVHLQCKDWELLCPTLWATYSTVAYDFVGHQSQSASISMIAFSWIISKLRWKRELLSLWAICMASADEEFSLSIQFGPLALWMQTRSKIVGTDRLAIEVQHVLSLACNRLMKHLPRLSKPLPTIDTRIVDTRSQQGKKYCSNNHNKTIESQIIWYINTYETQIPSNGSIK